MVEAEHGRFGSHVSASGLHPGGPGVATLSQQFAYMSDAGGGGDGGGGDGLADGGGGGKQQQKSAPPVVDPEYVSLSGIADDGASECWAGSVPKRSRRELVC